MSSPTFTDRLLVLFGAPRSIDDQLLIAEYQRLLASYSQEIVNAAVDRLARSHKWPGWPKVADVIAAAEDAIEARHERARAENGGARPETNAVTRARIAAARFVNGRGNGWEWAPDFRAHPLVVLAEAEGWARELRDACKRQAFLRLIHGIPRDAPTVDNVMTRDTELIAYWRAEARRAREAAEWRAANPNHRSIKGLGTVDAERYLARLGIQRPSPNRGDSVDPETGEITP
jgi:hypothetical protein